jgi:hypothetical protein
MFRIGRAYYHNGFLLGRGISSRRLGSNCKGFGLQRGQYRHIGGLNVPSPTPSKGLKLCLEMFHYKFEILVQGMGCPLFLQLMEIISLQTKNDFGI